MIKQFQVLLGVLFLAILAYSGLWYTAAFQAEKDIASLLAGWRDQGLLVEHGKIEHGGFPYRITVDIEKPNIAARNGGLIVVAEHIQLISHLWTPLHWLAEMNGLDVSAAGGSTKFKSGFMLASYRVHDDGKTLVAFDSKASSGFSLSRFAGIDIASPDTWQFFLRYGNNTATQESGLYSERRLGFKLAAGGNAYSFDMVGGLSGPSIKDWTSEQLSNWSNEGGLLEIDRFTYSAGGGTLKGNGSLTLDEKYQPLGSASLTIENGDNIERRILETGQELTSSLPKEGLVSLMLQNGKVMLNGAALLPLRPVIN